MPESWRFVSEALALDPDHLDANILAGDLWVTYWDDIGYEDHSECSAAEVALPYFDRALEIEPRHSDAWSGKSRALRRVGRFEEALAAAETGLATLPDRVDYLSSSEVYRYVAEELYEGKVKALLELGRREEARRALEEGLGLYPDSWYLKDIRAEVRAADSADRCP
jgi:tetratricopeptide (TPR) repeat protein